MAQQIDPRGPKLPPKHRAPSTQQARTTKYANFRKRVLKSRELWGGWYECEWCSKWLKKQDIDMDHIILRSQAPDKVYDEKNIRLLCRPCHIKRHNSVDNSVYIE